MTGSPYSTPFLQNVGSPPTNSAQIIVIVAAGILVIIIITLLVLAAVCLWMKKNHRDFQLARNEAYGTRLQSMDTDVEHDTAFYDYRTLLEQEAIVTENNEAYCTNFNITPNMAYATNIYTEMNNYYEV